jgi:hypothetical protein
MGFECWISVGVLSYKNPRIRALVFADAHDAIQIVKEPDLKELPGMIPNKFLHCKGRAEVR